MKNLLKITTTAVLAGILAINGGTSAMIAPAIEGTPVEAPAETPIYTSSNTYNTSGELDSEVLTSAILKYKTLFGLTDKYSEFYHYYSEYNGFSCITLNWSNEDENIDFSITDGGTIYSYSKYINSKTNNSFVIPSITKERAVTLAVGNAKKLNPEYTDYLSAEHATVNYIRNGSYRVNLYAYIDGKQLENQSVTVALTSDGELISYDSGSMTANLGAPSDEGKKIINNNEAENKLSAAVPFRLVYRSFYDYDDEKNRSTAEAKLVYIPGDGFSDTVIDAVSGNKLTVVRPNDYAFPEAGNGMMSDAQSVATDEESKLTEVEQNAVDLQDSFLTVEAIKELLIKKELFDFNDGYIFDKTSVKKNISAYTGREYYVRNISWKLTDGEDTEWAYITCDAETGEIFSFYSGSAYKKENIKKDNEKLIALASKALDALCPYASDYKAGDYYVDDYSDIFTQNYTRFNDEVEVLGDTVNITIDAKTSLVTQYNINRIDAKLEPAASAISQDKAAQMYFDGIGIKLSYIAAASVDEGKLTLPINAVDNESKIPVLAFGYNDNCFIDAVNGKLINYSGEEYKKSETKYFNPDVFNDVDESMYQIALLFNMDIIDGEKNFYPDRTITNEEFDKLLSGVNGYTRTFDDNNKPSDVISCQEAAKLIVESIGYGEVASLEGIFKLPFENGDKVENEYVGYVAIAYGLGLFENICDDLNPSAELTRGEAAGMICSYIENIAKKGN